MQTGPICDGNAVFGRSGPWLSTPRQRRRWRILQVLVGAVPPRSLRSEASAWPEAGAWRSFESRAEGWLKQPSRPPH